MYLTLLSHHLNNWVQKNHANIVAFLEEFLEHSVIGRAVTNVMCAYVKMEKASFVLHSADFLAESAHSQMKARNMAFRDSESNIFYLKSMSPKNVLLER